MGKFVLLWVNLLCYVANCPKITTKDITGLICIFSHKQNKLKKPYTLFSQFFTVLQVTFNKPRHPSFFQGVMFSRGLCFRQLWVSLFCYEYLCFVMGKFVLLWANLFCYGQICFVMGKFVLLSISLFCYRYLCFVIDIFVLLSISLFCYDPYGLLYTSAA